MQRILSTLKRTIGQSILVLGLMFLISIANLFLFVQKPSYATTYSANKLTPEEKIDRAYEYNEAAGFREEKRQQAYEQAIKDSKSPQSLEKAYERNLKAENVQEPNLIEKTEELIKDVTSK